MKTVFYMYLYMYTENHVHSINNLRETNLENTYFISTSGLLCLSTCCELKFSRHIAAVNVCLMAVR